jgi:5-methylcytosine-specific restriction enzyme subunit McrC
MSTSDVQILQWKEYEPVRYQPGKMSDALGNALYHNFRNHVTVEFPTPKTDGMWEFTPLGWVGTIPVTDSLVVNLQPKAPLGNLFRMWEYAYRLKGFKFLDGIINCQSCVEFYQNLAGILANRVLDRTRQGLYRTYLGREDRLPYVSGRLDIRSMAFEPWRTDLRCAYEEHTADVEENQILCWTLSVIARSGLCDERILSKVRRAYRELIGCTTPVTIYPKSCIGRLYNRLNDDYEPLHGLCRFFLEHRGPTHNLGDNAMMPFLMDMARLYELFVAEWLKQHLPEEYELKAQHNVNFGSGGELQFRIDVVILDRKTSTPLLILDTKYKVPDSPSSSDIHEVRSYAEALGCTEAVLAYPIKLPNGMDVRAGNIRVRTLTFAVAEDLEEAGMEFLSTILAPE